MKNIIWKAFKLGSLFSWSSRKDLSLKNYNLIDEYEDGCVEVVTGSMDKNNKFVLKRDLPEGYPVYKDCICINTNGSIGYSFYYKNDIVSPTSSVHVLIHKNEYLKAKMDEIINNFFATMITNIFTKSMFNRTSCLIDNDKFDREIILLPCLEVSNDEEHIWEEAGHYYILAVDYIKKLMNEAKELKEKKTIRLYEEEKTKYEKKREIYKEKYLKEKERVIWKAFKLGSLFSWSSRKDLSLKNYNLINEYEDGCVEVVTGSMDKNNKFVLKSDLPEGYPVYKDCICINTNGSIGYSFYYKNDIVSPTSSVHVLIHKNEYLKAKMDEIINDFFATMITNIFTKSMFNRTSCLIDNDKFDREIILLPCLEIDNDEEYIWEENGNYYTLAVDYVHYIYLSGRVNAKQKLIDNYKYQY